MQIRVVVRWRRVKLNDSVHKVCNIIGHLPCVFGYHDEELDIGNGKLGMRCARCGWKSPGLTVDGPRTAAPR
jgi:hypothetical protein